MIDMKALRARQRHRRGVLTTAALCALTFAGLSCGGASDATKPVQLPQLSTLQLLDDSVLIAVGDSLDVPYVAARTDGTAAGVVDLKWDTRNSSVARFAEQGLLVGTGAGRTWVVASNASLADSTLVVVRQPLSIQLSSHLDTLTSLGDTLPLSVSVSGAQSDQVSLTWASRDSGVVRVMQNGRAIATSEGTTYLLVREDAGGVDSIRVVVQQRVVGIAVSPTVDSVPLGRAVKLAGRPVDARGATIARLGAVTWSSARPTLASVDHAGLVTALAQGTDTISASVSGFTRAMPLVVAPPPPLRFSRDTINIGVGQYPSAYAAPLPLVIADSFAMDHPVPITFTMADSTIAVEGTPVSLGTYGPDSAGAVRPFGRRAGVTVMTATGPGYGPGSVVVRVTTPKLDMIDSVLPLFDPAHATATSTMFADFQDSLGHEGQLWRPATVRYRASDTTVVVPSASSVTVDSGQIDVTVRMRATGPGVAWLIAYPDGYTPDSTRVHVTTYAPRLLFTREPGATNVERGASMYLGAGESTTYYQVGVFASALGGWSTTVPLTLSHGRRAVIAIPDSANRDNGYFHVQALTEGRDTIISTAAGYRPDSLIVIVTRPSFRFNFGQTTYATLVNAPTFPTTTMFHKVTLQAIYTDSAGTEQRGPFVGDEYVARLTSTDTNVLRPDRDSIIFTGGSSDGQDIHVTGVGPGTARLVLSDAKGRAIPDTSIAITVAPAAVHLRYVGAVGPTGGVTVGFRQTLLPDEHVYIDVPVGVQYAAPVRLHSSNDAIIQPSAATVHGIDFTADDGHFDLIGGTEAGSAWIVADGPGIIPDSLLVTVGQPQLQLVQATTADTNGFGVALRPIDQAGLLRRTVDSVRFSLRSTNWSVLSVDSASLGLPGMASATPGHATVHFAGQGTAAVQIRDTRTVPYGYRPAATRLITVDASHHPLTELLLDSLPPLKPGG